ncbi:MAG: hydrogenase maturation protease [Phycisphaerae bacterium]|nr:hydrogenase maturation protease [Phycisphaerae bacterium]
MAKLTVLGIGNILMRDDGVGVHLLEAVRRARPWPAEVEFVDGGAGGLGLLGVIEQAQRLVVFDAADLHAPAGSHRILTAEQLSDDSPGRISLHDMPFAQTLALCRQFLQAPRDVVILAIQPAEVGPGRALSPVLQREFGTLVQTVVTLVDTELSRTSAREVPQPRGED